MIRREAGALDALADTLGTSFVAAVDLLMAAKGRVIVSGMGKSGHVARKIAATFASTGTPAHFVHPAEASHGDLGMVAEGDVLIVLSNSGETSELADILAHAKRFGGDINVHIAGQRVSHHQRRRCQIIRAHIRRNPPFKVAIARQNRHRHQITLGNRRRNLGLQRPRIADASGAAIAHKVKPNRIQINLQARRLQIFRHNLRSRCQ